MANNPYVNKVQKADGTVLMDISGDTVTPNDVRNGVTFHDRSGAQQQGGLIISSVYDGLDSTSATDALSAKQGKALKDQVDAKSSIKVEKIRMDGTGSVASGANADITKDVSSSGWNPVGIVGWVGSGTGKFAMQELWITNGGTAHYYVRNLDSSAQAIAYIDVYVLYVKST